MDNNKMQRVLGIYTKLMGGYLVNKAEEALNYQVNERSIQRDIDDIRHGNCQFGRIRPQGERLPAGTDLPAEAEQCGDSCHL